jgi:class 3 adenylate cyclase
VLRPRGPRDACSSARGYFRDPAAAVVAAVEMTAVVVGHGLPPAHVGVCAGPVIFQEGDYFGRTVNLAARIAEYARPGQVLVSQEVVDASRGRSGSPSPTAPPDNAPGQVMCKERRLGCGRASGVRARVPGDGLDMGLAAAHSGALLDGPAPGVVVGRQLGPDDRVERTMT